MSERQTYEVTVTVCDYFDVDAPSRAQAREKARERAERSAGIGWTVEDIYVSGQHGGEH